jgi:hypothetical protein
VAVTRELDIFSVVIFKVFFVAICAAVFPGSSAVPVDEDAQEDQGITA